MPEKEPIELSFVDTILIKNLSEEAVEQGKISELTEYVEAAMWRLSSLEGKPGYEMALEAERDIIAIKTGLRLFREASERDKIFIGMIAGGLRLAVRIICRGANL